MGINFLHRAFRTRTFKLFMVVSILLLTISLWAVVADWRRPITKRVNIALRAIGHNLLLQDGDSTSIVRPVIEKSRGVFLLEFENEFAFQPDTLVTLAQRFVSKTGLSQYTVTVQECHSPEMVYGFEINSMGSVIIPCRGRMQPKACYNIEVAFADYPDPTIPYLPLGMLLTGIVSVLAVVLIGRNLTPKNQEPVVNENPSTQNEPDGLLTLGRFTFDTNNQILKMGDAAIPLTEKEWKILLLLNRNIGSLTMREELIQQVWTDDGVITGRSLDMFISKLRKKISPDSTLRITNIHGKGYKLEVINDVVE